jgi:NADH-quinone oxidoreductase subunit G
VAQLRSADRKAIWLGQLAIRHPAYASLRSLASALAVATGASLGVLAEGANAAGAHLAGVLPQRGAAGVAVATPGLDARAMLEKSLHSYVLLGIEPGADSVVAGARAALAGAKFVVALTPYESAELKSYASVLLPIGSFAETSGTYVSLEGEWQSFSGAAQPVGDSRPGWKVLRVLGNLLGLQGFEQQSSEDVRADLRGLIEASAGKVVVATSQPRVAPLAADAAVVDVPLYQIDGLVRRAASLQATRDGQTASSAGVA